MVKLILIAALTLAIVFPPNFGTASRHVDCDSLAEIFDTQVEEQDGRCEVEIVRKNLNVTHMGKKLSPETMGLMFHFTFENVDDETAVIGELALLEAEVNPVIDELQKGNLEISSLSNHMLHERPRILYVHFQGIGDLKQQARTIKAAIEKTGYN